MVPDPIQQVLVKELLRPRVDPFSYEISTVQRNKHSTTTIFARGLDRYTLIFASQPYYFVYNLIFLIILYLLLRNLIILYIFGCSVFKRFRIKDEGSLSLWIRIFILFIF
jgi:hypothetical protein